MEADGGGKKPLKCLTFIKSVDSELKKRKREI